MGKLVALAYKDFRVLIADKGNLFWVFVFPAVFAMLFGAVYSGADDGPSGMNVAVVDEDQSEFSQLYVSHLESDEALNVTRLEYEQALTDVRKGKQPAIQLADEVWQHIKRKRTRFQLAQIIEDVVPTNAKVTKIWGEKKRGQATLIDRVLVLYKKEYAELTQHVAW